MTLLNIASNLIAQYIIVGIILLAASAWIIWKLIKLRKKGVKSCCGCALADACEKNKNKKRP